MPQIPVGSRRGAFLAGVAVTAVVAAAAFLLWPAREAPRADSQAAGQAERELQAQLKVLRRRTEEVEQALIDAEQQAAHARKQQERPYRPAFVPVASAPRPVTETALRASAARAPAVRRQASAERARQEALERRRMEEAAAAQPRPAPPAPPPPAPPPPAPAPVARSAEQVCGAMSNFLARAVCETRECIKPENVRSDYCAAIRARSAPQQLP